MSWRTHDPRIGPMVLSAVTGTENPEPPPTVATGTENPEPAKPRFVFEAERTSLTKYPKPVAVMVTAVTPVTMVATGMEKPDPEPPRCVFDAERVSETR